MLPMYKQVTIKTLYRQGLKQSEIAKQLSCHRHTVANVLQRENFIEKQTRVKDSVYAAFDTKIKEYLDKVRKDE